MQSYINIYYETRTSFIITGIDSQLKQIDSIRINNVKDHIKSSYGVPFQERCRNINE